MTCWKGWKSFWFSFHAFAHWQGYVNGWQCLGVLYPGLAKKVGFSRRVHYAVYWKVQFWLVFSCITPGFCNIITRNKLKIFKIISMDVYFLHIFFKVGFCYGILMMVKKPQKPKWDFLPTLSLYLFLLFYVRNNKSIVLCLIPKMT